jgi:hypothetical protein
MDWNHLAQDRHQWRVLVKTIVNVRVRALHHGVLTIPLTGGLSDDGENFIMRRSFIICSLQHLILVIK